MFVMRYAPISPIGASLKGRPTCGILEARRMAVAIAIFLVASNLADIIWELLLARLFL